MLVVPITDHVQQALDRLMQQYKEQPRLAAIITALVQQIQDLEDAIYPLDVGRQLATAVGVQLDGLGELIGLKRNGLDDATYRLFLIGTIAKNYSDTTLPTIQTILDLLLDPEVLLIFEKYPAAIAVEFSGSIREPSLYSLVATLVQGALGAGIRLAYMAVMDDTNPFRFLLEGSPGPQGDGFADDEDPGSGGKWSEDIYTSTTSS